MSEEEAIDPIYIEAVMKAVAGDEPAVHLIGSMENGFQAYGPYEDRDDAQLQHEPEIEQIITIFDRDVRPEDTLTEADVSTSNFGALWCWGDLVDGYGLRGIYRDVNAAIEANHGKDGFAIAMVGQLDSFAPYLAPTKP